ncbi:YceI family protein [Novosphingobium taihuense]|uniref:Polyisoprenoid-binding protein YceI n=1 Tax=Novosphingobium taihuense TaxID=260085 RepID=A0A7W7A8F7_9SPHN|nr:YceI family protein [Novosphingobium taihuense]MBB4612340.1 polyisoprenoid-binding protein YceI [Novosphingobium taihuense]TWH88307.1 polyisoprenoid-binding protein YceI [Novosphingobium taihuense]
MRCHLFKVPALLLATVASLAPALANPAPSGQLRYRLDGPRSEVHAKVGFFGIASKTARFPAVTGGIDLDPNHLDAIRLDVMLDATALEAGDQVTLKRLKGPDFFDVANYPSVRFIGKRMTMTGPVTATISGDLTARGVTRPTVLTVSFADPPSRATGREPIRLSARAKIDRTDFGMNAYRLIVSKSVTITINAQMVPA